MNSNNYCKQFSVIISGLTFIVSLFFSLAFSLNATAKDLYISDQLFVPVRKGQGNKYTILHKGLPSGTRVTLLERDTDWTKVQTGSGLIGWVRNQYLLENPTASVSLVQNNQAMERLKTLNSSLSGENTELKKTLSETKGTLDDMVKKSDQTEAALDDIKSISGKAIQTHEQVQVLAREIQLLQTENDVLISEKERLEKNERTTFFLYGAFAVLLGVLITIILPKLRSQKRNKNGWVN